MPAGFVNLGNTCYINSVLQCFLRCDGLNTLLSSTVIHPSTQAQEFLKEYDDLRKLALSGNVVVRPERFIQHIQIYAKYRNISAFMQRDQNDVCEFIHFMVDAFHSAYCADPDQSTATQSFNMMEGRFQSPIMKLFYGVHAFVVTEISSGETLATTPEPFFLLDLPIPANASTLVECLQAYAVPEVFDDWRDTLGRAHAVSRRCVFTLLPPILFISLKRFNSSGRKDNANVDIPEFLIVGAATYRLVAVCVHSGSVGGGHYTACVWHDRWVCIDDENISPTLNPTKDGYCFVFANDSQP